MTQADITSAVDAGFVLLVGSHCAAEVPHLVRFSRRWETLPPSKAAPVPPSQPGEPGHPQLPL